jgi:hypothetical protein
MTAREMRQAGLSGYQISEIRKMERDGWTIGPIKSVGDEMAAIEAKKGAYHSVIGFPATRWLDDHYRKVDTA